VLARVFSADGADVAACVPQADADHPGVGGGIVVAPVRELNCAGTGAVLLLLLGAWQLKRVVSVPGVDSDASILSVMGSVGDHEPHSQLMLSAVDRSHATDLYEQVAAEIRRAIADGEARPGERIGQAKDLAAVLGVNPNTVLRALRLLRDEGLLEIGRGRAIRVAGTPERGAVVTKMNEVIKLARHYGYRDDDLVSMLETMLQPGP
jgi:GntR family transcriptional regulator